MGLNVLSTQLSLVKRCFSATGVKWLRFWSWRRSSWWCCSFVRYARFGTSDLDDRSSPTSYGFDADSMRTQWFRLIWKNPPSGCICICAEKRTLAQNADVFTAPCIARMYHAERCRRVWRLNYIWGIGGRSSTAGYLSVWRSLSENKANSTDDGCLHLPRFVRKDKRGFCAPDCDQWRALLLPCRLFVRPVAPCRGQKGQEHVRHQQDPGYLGQPLLWSHHPQACPMPSKSHHVRLCLRHARNYLGAESVEIAEKMVGNLTWLADPWNLRKRGTIAFFFALMRFWCVLVGLGLVEPLAAAWWNPRHITCFVSHLFDPRNG